MCELLTFLFSKVGKCEQIADNLRTDTHTHPLWTFPWGFGEGEARQWPQSEWVPGPGPAPERCSQDQPLVEAGVP